MDYTVSDVLAFVRENDVKFIRLSFCDMFGLHKNISIMADELESAFVNGVSFDAHTINGFGDVTRSELLLFPDPNTPSVLPWRPGQGRVLRFYCDIKHSDGIPFEQDSRFLLKQAVERCEKMGYACKVGAECEFYLFKTDDDGEPTDKPYDNGKYLDITPLDKGENMRREICLTLEEMGVVPESSHHEQGPGQNEIVFKFGDALSCADNMQTFKSVVKAVAMRNGLFASFMPRPIFGAPGSGLHINISLSQNKHNIFKNINEGHSNIAESFIAGVLSRIPEITLFLNPLANSYERFGTFEAPKYVSWSHQNRSQLVRIPLAVAEKIRMELRSPDPSANPYLAFALILAAGLDGIESELPLGQPVDADLYIADESVTKGLSLLPDNMEKALAAAKGSGFANGVLGDAFFSKYIAVKEAEFAAFTAAEDKETFYKEWYFSVT